MTSSSDWYQDAAALEATVRKSLDRQGPAPAIPGYVDLKEIARGGQGIVYTATQQSTRRVVAIKMLLDGTYASYKHRIRFKREIGLVAGLRHPNIVSVYDSGITPDGWPYLVMEYIEGTRLDDFTGVSVATSASSTSLHTTPNAVRHAHDSEASLPEAPVCGLLQVRAALRLFADICNAVTYAHQHGVIHRDLKPSNILIDRQGQPHILDFGLAKIVSETPEEESDSLHLSVSGCFMGSMAWASPEQAEGNPRATDTRSDVYSLGVILYQMITGRFPYETRGKLRDVLDNILTADPIKPRSIRPQIGDEVETIVLKCLTKESALRYQSAGEVAADVRRYLADEPILARRHSAVYQIRKFAKRNKALVGGLVSAMVLLVLGIAGTGYGLLQADQQRRQAEVERDGAVAAKRRTVEINAFLNEMLKSADPAALGRDVTLQEVLTVAGSQVDRRFPQAPDIRASLHSTLGSTYHQLGLLPQAEDHLHRALEAHRVAHGTDDERTLDVQLELGRLLIDRDQLAESAGVLEDARRRARGAYGDRRPVVLRADAEWGALLHAQGRWSESRAILAETLSAQRRLLEPDDADTLYTMDCLAGVLLNLEVYDDAQTLFESVLEIQKETLGDDHPETISTLNDLAMMLNAAGRLRQAEQRYRETLNACEHVLGPLHRYTLVVRHNLAGNLVNQQRDDEAGELEEKTLEIRETVFGPDHYDTITSLNTLSVIRSHQGRTAEAEQLARRVLESHLKNRGERHPDTVLAMQNLATILRRHKRFDEAGELLVRVLVLSRQKHGTEHRRVVGALNALGVLRMDQERYKDAVGLLSEAVAVGRRVYPQGHYFIPWLLGNYGRALTGAEQYQDAETALLKSYETYESVGGDKHSDTQWTIRLLVQLYDAWGKPSEANEYRQRQATDGSVD